MISDHILVSICCTTYNQKDFIKDAIEGFLIQKTSFPLEIIIHDDASTDGSADIIREYFQKFPKLIIPILQTENQYSKKRNRTFAQYVMSKVRGKYVAICEGDDYWTDPYKLQKQVDFLEANPEYSISFHAAEHHWLNNGLITIHRYKCTNGFRTFTIKNAILKGGAFMTTNSMVFRTEYAKNLPEWYFLAPTGDFPLSLNLSLHGKVAYFDDVMSVYRRNVKGSWSDRLTVNNNFKSLMNETEHMLWSFNSFTKYNYFYFILLKIIRNRAQVLYHSILLAKTRIFN